MNREKEQIEGLLKALSGYLEGTDFFEVLYSPRRGYSVFRWDAQEDNYYGVMAIHKAEDLAVFVYKELMARIALEAGSDHTLDESNFDEMELAEARAATEKYLRILPEDIRDTLLKKQDPETGLLML